MQQHHKRAYFSQVRNKRGNVVILLLIVIAASVALLAMLLYQKGTFDKILSKNQSSNIPIVSKPAGGDELTKGDEVEDIEKDLNTTNLSETDKVLGEVDITLENQ